MNEQITGALFKQMVLHGAAAITSIPSPPMPPIAASPSCGPWFTNTPMTLVFGAKT